MAKAKILGIDWWGEVLLHSQRKGDFKLRIYQKRV